MFIYTHIKNNHLTTKVLGFGLIEVMIAATVLSLSLLGLASIQSRSLQLTKESSNRETAIRLLSQLSGFLITMDQNEIGALFNTTNVTNNCIGAFCNRSNFFNAIVQNWRNNLNLALPDGRGCVCVVPRAGNNETIMIRIAARWTSLSGMLNVEFLDNQFLYPNFTRSDVNCPDASSASGNNICNFR